MAQSSGKEHRRDPTAGPPTDWGHVAGWYDQLVGENGSQFQRDVVLPGTLRLLSPQPAERILDVACGQGVLCRALAQRGAVVVGVDAAREMIAAARSRGPETIEYHVGDARDLAFLPPEHFDAAVCSLAIQNIHPLPPVFAGLARTLKNSGRLVLVMMHPCFRGVKETSWGWDEPAKTQYRRVNRYLIPRKHPILTHPGSNPDQYTWTFHRPIEAYVNAIAKAGLMIDAMEEWASVRKSTSGPRAAAENLARKEIPMFLAIRAIKSAGQPH